MPPPPRSCDAANWRCRPPGRARLPCARSPGVANACVRDGAGGIGGLLARYRHATSSPYDINGVSFYHADGNGNVTWLASPTGGTDAAYRYDPFGRWVAQSGPWAQGNIMRFSSKPWFAHNYSNTDGLYYYGYRFYDPLIQRWLNRDPIGEKGGVNVYRFVRNAPTSQIDPRGLQTLPASPLPCSRPGGRPPIPDPNRRSNSEGWPQRYFPHGGRCCNHSQGNEWALVDGQWHELWPGECTPIFTDCDGMTCGGGFYAVGAINGDCWTPGCDSWPFANRRWEGPGGTNGFRAVSPEARGSLEGNTPPGYTYGPRPPCQCEPPRWGATHNR